MKFCQHCGKEIMDEAVICPGCGCAVQAASNAQVVTPVDDSVSVGLVILAVLLPIFGVIYWPVNAKKRPKCAKACGIAGIISWAVSFVIYYVMILGMF